MRTTFLEAANYTIAHRTKEDIWYLVIHDEEAPQDKGEADNVANYFHHQAHGPNGTSAHRVVDNSKVVHCVHWTDIAWAAPGANTNGVHWEQSGYVRDKKGTWEDKYGKAQMRLLAIDVANFCRFLHIHPVLLTPEDLRTNAKNNVGIHRGICGHDTVTKAFPNEGTHTDPGPHFPWTDFMSEVHAHYRRLA